MKIFYYCLYGIFLCFGYTSCSSGESMSPEVQVEADTNFIKKNEAYAIASMLEFDFTEDQLQTRSSNYLDVESIVPLGEDEKPTFYIVNYTNNSGFAIIAADKRIDPVLAFSTDGGFKLDSNNIPGGLLEWMQNVDNYVTEVRESNITQSPAITTRSLMCNALRSAKLRAINNNECFEYNGTNCPPEYQKTETVMPLLKTIWGQGLGFNNHAPMKNCNKYTNKRTPAGCVAVATAQIMYYYKHPKTYNWDDLKEMHPIEGGDEASRLIRDLGSKNALDIDYDCGGSGAHISDIPKALKKFGYKSASYKKLGEGDYELIRNQLRQKMPVILGGFTKSDFSFIGIHGEGHAWVCDGFIKTDNCTYSSEKFHMNWGWGYNNKSYNGWYSITDWTPQAGSNKRESYDQKKELVYNIQP